MKFHKIIIILQAIPGAFGQDGSNEVDSREATSTTEPTEATETAEAASQTAAATEAATASTGVTPRLRGAAGADETVSSNELHGKYGSCADRVKVDPWCVYDATGYYCPKTCSAGASSNKLEDKIYEFKRYSGETGRCKTYHGWDFVKDDNASHEVVHATSKNECEKHCLGLQLGNCYGYSWNEKEKNCWIAKELVSPVEFSKEEGWGGCWVLPVYSKNSATYNCADEGAKNIISLDHCFKAAYALELRNATLTHNTDTTCTAKEFIRYEDPPITKTICYQPQDTCGSLRVQQNCGYLHKQYKESADTTVASKDTFKDICCEEQNPPDILQCGYYFRSKRSTDISFTCGDVPKNEEETFYTEKCGANACSCAAHGKTACESDSGCSWLLSICTVKRR